MRKYILVAAAMLAPVSAVHAQTTVVPQSAMSPGGSYYTNNIGTNTLARNDDGSTGVINLGFTINFFGTDYSSLYINNNGNVTFGGPLSSYLPAGPTGANLPIISAWFADVDTRNANSGVVHWQLDTPEQLVVTWDNVGRYFNRGDLLNSFQMVIRGTGYNVPVGEGTIGFFYRQMPWETTDTSTTAAIGFGNGAGQAIVLEGSNQPSLNDNVQNRFIWFNQNLTPVPGAVPEPATWAMMIIGFGVVGGALRRRAKVSIAYA